MRPGKSKHEKSKYRKRGRKAFTPSAILPFFLFPFVLDYCYIAIFNKSKVAKFASHLLYTSFNGHSFNNLYSFDMPITIRDRRGKRPREFSEEFEDPDTQLGQEARDTDLVRYWLKTLQPCF
jgi:hypothetical protein